MLKRSFALVAIATLAACGGDESIDIPAQCNPLGGVNCMTPWPSALYEVEDSSTATGMRLAIPEGTLPTNIDGEAIDPTRLNRRDGFSASAPIITAFESGIDGSNLIDFQHYADSLTDASPTVIIDMETGERVAHFAELDARAADRPASQALYMRPAARLKGSHRYAVGIRKSLKARDGSDLVIPIGFQKILDGSDSGHELLEKMRPRYDAIFSAFEGAGIQRTDLVVAWDFTTASDASMQRDILHARDTALTMIGDTAANITFTVDKKEAHSDSRIAWRIEGTFEAPLFLTQNGINAPGTVIARDPASHLPVVQGMYEAPFVAIIPECALQATAPVGMMMYGHGLLGTADQVASGAIRDTAAALCVVVAGTDMRGMSEQDLVAVARSLNNYNYGGEIFDTLIQGVVNHIVLEQIMRGPMAQTLFVDDQNQTIVDPTQLYYYGLSQGHIFGSTVMAYDPFMTRGVVGVGAANYSMMLERSVDWPVHEATLTGSYGESGKNPLNVALMIHLMQMAWDTTDPSGTVQDILEGNIPGTPQKQLLLHMAMGDDQVPNVATEWQARTMGIPVLSPSPKQVWGMQMESQGMSSALVIFDGNFNPVPLTNEAPQGNGDAHSYTRKQPAAWRQMKEFYASGTVLQTCSTETGCTCETGACD
jgi:hypothetical protein